MPTSPTPSTELEGDEELDGDDEPEHGTVFFVRPGAIGKPPHIDSMFNLPPGYRATLAAIVARDKLTGKHTIRHEAFAALARYLFVCDVRQQQNPEIEGPFLIRSYDELDFLILNTVLQNRYNGSQKEFVNFLKEVSLYAVPR